jgi:hypothetical protein
MQVNDPYNWFNEDNKDNDGEVYSVDYFEYNLS